MFRGFTGALNGAPIVPLQHSRCSPVVGNEDIDHAGPQGARDAVHLAAAVGGHHQRLDAAQFVEPQPDQASRLATALSHTCTKRRLGPEKNHRADWAVVTSGVSDRVPDRQAFQSWRGGHCLVSAFVQSYFQLLNAGCSMWAGRSSRMSNGGLEQGR